MFFLFVKHVFLHKNIYFRASWNHVVLYSCFVQFRYSVTVWQFRMASISVCVKRKIVLGFGHFVTALQCDSSVLRCMQAKEVCLSIGILCEWASSAQGRRRCKLNIRMNSYVSFVALRLILSSVKTLWLSLLNLQ